MKKADHIKVGFFKNTKKKYMEIQDLKLYAVNITGIGITFTDFEGAYRGLMVVLSLWYAVSKIVEQRRQYKVNEYRRRKILAKKL